MASECSPSASARLDGYNACAGPKPFRCGQATPRSPRADYVSENGDSNPCGQSGVLCVARVSLKYMLSFFVRSYSACSKYNDIEYYYSLVSQKCVTYYYYCLTKMCSEKNQNAPRPSEHPPVLYDVMGVHRSL